MVFLHLFRCQENEIQNEIELIKDLLIEINSKGIFTINSQPVANCKPSDDTYVGWGPKDGYIFQRFYIEFFIDSKKLSRLIDYLKESDSISYQAINTNGGNLKSKIRNRNKPKSSVSNSSYLGCFC